MCTNFASGNISSSNLTWPVCVGDLTTSGLSYLNVNFLNNNNNASFQQ